MSFCTKKQSAEILQTYGVTMQMNRDEMLNKLKAIAEPLVSLTAFGDGGVICDYVSSEGCGGMELCDWSDLEFCGSPDRTWEEIDDKELEELLDMIDSGVFQPLSSILNSSES